MTHATKPGGDVPVSPGKAGLTRKRYLEGMTPEESARIVRHNVCLLAARGVSVADIAFLLGVTRGRVARMVRDGE